MLKGKIKLSYFALLISFINLILYHLPFYEFVCNNINLKSLSGILLLVSLTVLAIFLNAFVFYIGLFLLRAIGKWILILFFNMNAIALYFINTYSVIIDRSMIGNVLNTNFEESSSFFSFTLILYLIFLGIIPSILLFKVRYVRPTIKKFLVHTDRKSTRLNSSHRSLK
mgnify:FL=1